MPWAALPFALVEGGPTRSVARARLLALGTSLALSCGLAVTTAAPAYAAPVVTSPGNGNGNGNPEGHKADLLRYKAQRSGQTDPRSVASSTVLLTATAQNAAMASISTVGGAWRSIGPAPLGTNRGGLFGIGAAPYPDETGRVLALARSGNTVYLGAADGGIWKSTNLGGSWTPLGDHLASLAIGAIAVASGGGIILAGTGEPFAGGDAIRGVGIYRSTDGGQTWMLTGATGQAANIFSGESVAAIRFDPSSPTHVFAAYTNGLAVSTDGGQNWTPLTDSAVNGLHITDLEIDSAGNLFAARGNSGDPLNGVYYSTDHGSSWTRVESFGGTNTWVWRLALAPSTAGLPRSSQVIYAVAGDAQARSHLAVIARSLNGGVHWDEVTAASIGDTSDQAWYDIYVAVDPTNASNAFVGLIDVYRTPDAGLHWINMTGVYSPFPAAIHSDQHAALFMGGTILFGNDGGVYKSTDNGVSYSSANGTGLAITQYYGGDISATASGTMLGGAQDNGNPLTTNGGGSWTDISSGDGFYTAIDFNNPRNLYFEYTKGFPQYSNDGGAGVSNVCSGLFQPGLCSDPAAFGAPLVMDPSNPMTLYSAHQNHLWKTTDGMHSWTMLASPAGGSLPSALAVAPTSPTTIYSGDFGGNTWVSSDGGNHFTSTNASSCNLPSPNCGSGGISALAVDPSDSRIVYATVTGYVGSQQHHIFRSTDSGATWHDISTRLPDLPFQDIAINLNNTSVLYAAADIGVYISNDSGLTWSVLGQFLPNARVFHLSMRGNQLVAWTHGRGAWKLDLTTVPPPSTAIVSLPTPGGGDACRTTNLPRNDDNSSTAVNFGFTVNFFGTSYSSGYVNNNGNFTFDTPLYNYTPFPLTTTNHAILAPFFADVDTRAVGSDIVTYSFGNGDYFGRKATPPTTSAVVSPTPNTNGWNRTDVSVTLTATDALSGIDVTEFAVDGAPFAKYTAPIAITTEGIHSLLYRSRDRAGNLESTQTLTVKIDKTAPEAFLQFDATTHDLALFGRDTLSGVVLGPVAPQSVIPGTGQHETRTYHVADLAGNTLDVVVDVIATGNQRNATITSLSYNGAAPVAPVDNTLKFEWSGPNDAPVDKLNQRVETGQGADHVQITADWDAKSAQTVIHRSAGDVTQPGLVLLRLATSAGQLVIES